MLDPPVHYRLTNIVQKPAFTAWDKVFLLDASGAKQGPYYIASVVSPQMYTLCLEDGTDFRGGSEIGKEFLIPA